MAGAESPHVAVVVLSFNAREDTLACVESLERMDWERLTTIVVDNASADGTLEAVQERFPGVVAIRNEENLGFAGGNNIGMRAALDAGADYVLVLNNDTVTDERLVAELVAVASARPDAGTLCPLIRYVDPPDRIWYAGARFDPRAIHNGRHTGYGERDVGQYHTIRETGRATGAAMLVPRRVLEEVGLFDSKLFIQVEDVDISLRMRAAGYRILFVPTAIVWHRVALTSGGERGPATAYYEMRNSLAVSFRHAPARGLERLRREAGMLGVHLLHSRLAPAPVENARAILSGWRDFRAGRFGPRGEPRRVAGGPAPYAARDAARSRA
jgi:GT2 family glycosyltransferase